MPYITSNMQTVVETPTYLNQARRAGVSSDDLRAIVDFVASDPKRGDLIPGTGGARKVRFAPAGRGKRGGYRVIYYPAAIDVPIFLLALLSKGQRADLSQSERNELRIILSSLAKIYRQSVRDRTR